MSDVFSSFHMSARAQIVDIPNTQIRVYLDGAHTPLSIIEACKWFQQVANNNMVFV